RATSTTTGFSTAVSSTVLSATGSISGMVQSPARLRLPGSTRLVFQFAAQLLFLVLDEPADHLPPQRLAQIRRHALLGGARAHLVDHLLVAPGHARLLLEAKLDLPGALHVAEPLGNQVDEAVVDAVDLDADLGQVGAIGGGTGSHGSPQAQYE